ncbi:putative aminohydrolase SsnA [bacterium]|nr:putative aminohydrolase SsnA [bacterium]
MSLLIKSASIFTFNDRDPLRKGEDILIEGGLIKAIGPALIAPEADIIEARGGSCLPGYINAHTHLYSSLARGIQISNTPSNFGNILKDLWWKVDRVLDQESLYYSVMAALIDSIKSGTTTLFDHHASPNYILGSLQTIALAVQEAGLRACLCYEVSDRNGLDQAQKGIQENRDFIRYCQSENPELLRASFGLHASFTLSDQTLRECEHFGNQLDSGYHLHVAEDHIDVDDSICNYGKRVVERLDDHGLLGPKTLAVHGVDLSDGEIGLLAERATRVIHNPESNMNNGVGYAPILRMMDRGVKVALGTDGYSSSMPQALRIGNLLPKLIYRDPAMGTDELKMVFTQNNPGLASQFWGKTLGKIEIGASADLILVDYEPPTPLNLQNWWYHFLFGISGAPVQTLIVNGKLIMRDRRILTFNENEMLTRARKAAEGMWRRFSNE